MASAKVSAFFDAVTSGRLDEVRKSVAGDPSLLSAKDESGRTPLAALLNIRRYAFSVGDLNEATASLEETGQDDADTLAMAGYLMDAGSDLNAVDKNDFTPLLLATTTHKFKVARMLIEKGCNVTRPLSVGDYAGFTPLHAAAGQRAASLVPVLVAHGADVNAQDAEGRTPLHVAVLTGAEMVAGALLKLGADTKLCDTSKRSAVDLALDKGMTRMADVLTGRRKAKEDSKSPKWGWRGIAAVGACALVAAGVVVLVVRRKRA